MPRISARPTAESVLDQERQPVALFDRPPAPKPKIQPATPPPKPPTPPEVQAILERRAAESRLLLDAAEQVLILIAEGESPTAEQQSLLTTLGIIGERRAAEVLRLKRVLGLQVRSGTESQRDQARQAAETAAAELARRGPEIDADIQRLTAERTTLATTAKVAQALVERQASALDSLRNRDLLPSEIRAELDDAGVAHRDRYAARIRDLRGQIELTERLAAMESPYTGALAYAEQADLPCFQRVPARHDSAVPTMVDVPGWLAHLAERQAADIGRRSEIERLESEAAPLIERREALLSYYVR